MARLRSLIDVYNTSWQSPRTIGYKTKAWYDNTGFSVRLHATNVVSYDVESNTVTICTAGWTTKITAERIRHGLQELGLQLLTRDLPNRWRVADYNGNAWTIRNRMLRLRRVGYGWERN